MTNNNDAIDCPACGTISTINEIVIVPCDGATFADVVRYGQTGEGLPPRIKLQCPMCDECIVIDE